MKRAKDVVFIRRYFKSFTKSERKILRDKINTFDESKLEFSYHFEQRILDYNVTSTREQIVAAIKHGKIIDYSRCERNRPIERFLIRDMSRTDVHVVIAVHHENGRWAALTVWENDPNDMHETLDMSIYDRTFSIHDCVDN